VLLAVKTVGSMSEGRTNWLVGLRAVTPTDGMTADFYPFDMSAWAIALRESSTMSKAWTGDLRCDVEAAGDDWVGVRATPANLPSSNSTAVGS